MEMVINIVDDVKSSSIMMAYFVLAAVWHCHQLIEEIKKG
jgi:hypothetical protein